MTQGGISGGDALEFELALSDVAHLFNPPGVDPRSTSAPELLGVSGLDYLLSHLHIHRKRLQTRTLVLGLPAGKNADAAEITQGLHRVVDARLARDGLELRNIYRYGFRVALVSVLLLAVCLALSHMVAPPEDATSRKLLRKTLEYGFEIVGWVLLWHPIDVLFFNPLVVRHRMRALRAVRKMQVMIREDRARN